MSFLLEHLFPSMKWHIPSSEKNLYLTFDDGPIPEVTPWVINVLSKYNAVATFFCVGANVQKHPALFKMICDGGHAVGNHTMHHVNGWKTKNAVYYSDIEESKTYIHSSLFRPPYGKMKISQMHFLKNEYRIIMWDVLSRDYDPLLTGETCFQNVKNSSRPGSIIVFHDSLKAEVRLRIALPATLNYFSAQGYSFRAIPS